MLQTGILTTIHHLFVRAAQEVSPVDFPTMEGSPGTAPQAEMDGNRMISVDGDQGFLLMRC